MTNPITFTPTPYPVLDVDADGVDAFGDISTVSAANFAKINPWFTGHGSRIARATTVQKSNVTSPRPNDGNWHVFDPDDWAPVSLIVPPTPVILLVTVSSETECDSASTEIWVSFALTGDGTNKATNNDLCAQLASAQRSYGSRVSVVLNNQNGFIFTPGKTLTFNPCFKCTGTGAISIARGSVSAIVMSGGAV